MNKYIPSLIKAGHAIASLIGQIRDSTILVSISYRDLLNEIDLLREKSPAARAAFAEWTIKGDIKEITLVLLDESRQPILKEGAPIGKKILTKALDKELLEVFGEHRSILFT